MRSATLFLWSLMLVGAALGTRTFIPLDPISDTVSSSAPFRPLVGAYGNVAVTGSVLTDEVTLFERNSTGFYTKKATVPVAPSGLIEVSTDGSWIAASFIGHSFVQVFQIEGSSVVNLNTFPSAFDAARLIAPNTLLVVNVTHLTTYEYNSGKWLVVDASPYGTPSTLNYISNSDMYRATENTFVGIYNDNGDYYIFLMQRQADKTWTLYDQFVVDIEIGGDFPIHCTWNGNDTVLVAFGQSAQLFSTYTRSGPGSWQQTNIRHTDVGYTLNSYLGHAVLALDADNFLIAAPYHSYISDASSGGVLLMHRDGVGSDWQFTAEFGRFSFRNRVQFGFGLAANDYDALMYGCISPPSGNVFTCAFYTYPRCFTAPIDVTCPSPGVLEACSSVAVEDLITVNNPQCGSVSYSTPAFNWSENGIQFNVTFERPMVTPVTCSINMACPQIPVAVSTPTTAPQSTAPVSSTVPVAVPNAVPNGRVSAASEVALDAFAFVGAAIAAFLII